ncbi:hypothetical protein ES704_01989 [subsurface metagenome]
MGNRTRTLAFWMVTATLIGSIAPEFGNLVALQTKVHPHYYNRYFLVVGVLGILGYGLALLIRLVRRKR